MNKAMSKGEEQLALHLRAAGIEFTREFKFHATRKWRFDFALPDHLIAVEVEGGAWTNGRHTRGKGFIADLEKYEEAMRLGWNVYRCSPEMVKNGRALETIEILMRLHNE